MIRKIVENFDAPVVMTMELAQALRSSDCLQIVVAIKRRKSFVTLAKNGKNWHWNTPYSSGKYGGTAKIVKNSHVYRMAAIREAYACGYEVYSFDCTEDYLQFWLNFRNGI